MVLNPDDWGVGLRLRLCTIKAADELACYIIGRDGFDHCHVGFTAREYAARDNRPWLDGAIIEIMTVFTPDSENRSMCRLYHHNHGYVYDIFLI